MMIEFHMTAVLFGCALDGLIGDPQGFPHSVRAIGGLISWLESRLRTRISKGMAGERSAGRLLVALVLAATGVAAAALLATGYTIHPYAGVAVESVMCWQMMAWRSLRSESMKVYKALEQSDVEGARQAVAMIVGRDTEALTDIGITKAAVETVAENTSDGVIAPLFYMAIGGAMGGWLYKAVNTMDSMVGYQNERYLWFGRAAAKLDDFCNYVPARLSAALMIAAGVICGAMDRTYSIAGGLRIFIRDRYRHKSPNSAQTESACAGILQIELGGDAYYFGKLCEKPTIGDPIRSVEYEDIRRANRLLTVTYLLALICFGIWMWALGLIFS